MLFVYEGVVTGLWNCEKCEVCVVPCKVLMFYWLAWTNESLVVEFRVLPTKVNHILTLGVTMEIFGVRYIQNGMKFGIQVPVGTSVLG